MCYITSRSIYNKKKNIKLKQHNLDKGGAWVEIPKEIQF